MRALIRGGARAAVVAATGVLLLAGLAAMAARNLGATGMWWDEAAQFWVSQGLSNYSPPFAPRQGVRDVVRRNRFENLDPGGFSLLLHAWTAAGRGLERLRALPLAFFLLGAAALGALGWRLTRSGPFALAAAAVPALFPAALYFAFEIRAYGMEMAGVTVGALALAAALERPTPACSVALGLACAVFMSSRYSYALFVAAMLAAFTCAVVRRDEDPGAKARRLAGALLPVLVAAALAWWITLRHQLWPEMRGGALGVRAPAYTLGALPGGPGDTAALLARNLFSPAALPLTACVVFVALVRRRAYSALALAPAPAAALRRPRAVFAALHATVLGTLALSAAAALVGAYPWDIASRWSAYLVMVSALAAVVVAAEAVVLARAALPERAGRAGIALALAVTLAAGARAATYRYAVDGLHRADLAGQLAALPLAAAPDRSVFVAFYESPVLRYLYEHGPLAGRGEYPGAFLFEPPAAWRAHAPLDLAGVSYVIWPAPLAEVSARCPGTALRPIGPGGASPFAVVRHEPAQAGAPPRESAGAAQAPGR